MVKSSTAFLGGAVAAGTILTTSQVFVPAGVNAPRTTSGPSLHGISSGNLEQPGMAGSSFRSCAAVAAVCAVAGAAASKAKGRAAASVAVRARFPTEEEAAVKAEMMKGGELSEQVKKIYDASRITGSNINGYLDIEGSGGLITGFAPEFGPIGKMQPQAMKVFAGGLVGSELSGFGGDYKFDPLGLSARWPEHLAWWREAELKHARVAMMAFAGLLAPDVVRLPFEECADPDLNFANAHNQLITGLGSGPMWWLLVVIGALESIRFKQLGKGFEDLKLENAGDLGLFKLPEDEERKLWMQMAELKNGRLAMLAVSGIFTAGVLWGEYHFPFYPLK